MEVPKADTRDALVVALSADGVVYLGAAPIQMAALGDRLKSIVSSRADKTLYLKTDARVASARLIEVLDVLRTSGVEAVTLLTAQRDAADRRTLVPSKGLELQVVQP